MNSGTFHFLSIFSWSLGVPSFFTFTFCDYPPLLLFFFFLFPWTWLHCTQATSIMRVLEQFVRFFSSTVAIHLLNWSYSIWSAMEIVSTVFSFHLWVSQIIWRKSATFVPDTCVTMLFAPGLGGGEIGVVTGRLTCMSIQRYWQAIRLTSWKGWLQRCIDNTWVI